MSSFLKEYLDFTWKLESLRQKILRYIKAKEKHFNMAITFLLLNPILSLDNRLQDFVYEAEAKRKKWTWALMCISNFTLNDIKTKQQFNYKTLLMSTYTFHLRR